MEKWSYYKNYNSLDRVVAPSLFLMCDTDQAEIVNSKSWVSKLLNSYCRGIAGLQILFYDLMMIKMKNE